VAGPTVSHGLVVGTGKARANKGIITNITKFSDITLGLDTSIVANSGIPFNGS
jgi:hypothetical protein